MSRVDVIVPCYRYAHYLRGCVGSVLSQAGPDVRVLIIDDASPDHTSEVAAKLAAGDGRVEFRRHAVNRGHIATYNEGLDWAEGEYTVLLSADDLLAPGALARAVGLLDDHPEVGLAYGRGIVFGKDEPPPPTEDGLGRKVIPGMEFLESCCAEGGNLVCTPTAIVRTRLQQRLGGYRADLPHAGDMEMWMRFAAHAHVAFIDADQAYYRVHGANMSGRWYSQQLADLRQRKAAFDALFRYQSEAMSDAGRLRPVADRAMSSAAFWAASRVFDEGDLSSCRDMLQFALEVDPGLRDRPEYGRLLWKQRLGFRAWSTLRPAVVYWRGRRGGRSPAAQARSSRPTGLLSAPEPREGSPTDLPGRWTVSPASQTA